VILYFHKDKALILILKSCGLFNLPTEKGKCREIFKKNDENQKKHSNRLTN